MKPRRDDIHRRAKQHRRGRISRADTNSAARSNARADADARLDRKHTRQTLHNLTRYPYDELDELSIEARP